MTKQKATLIAWAILPPFAVGVVLAVIELARWIGERT